MRISKPSLPHNVAEDNKNRIKIIFRVIAGLIWISAAILYMAVSSITEAWSITWVIFVFALIIHNIAYDTLTKINRS